MMTDDQLLDAMGLSDDDMKDLQAKHKNFIDSLNPAQKEVMKKTLPTPAAAAATFHGGVTAEHLEKFIRARAPKSNLLLFGNESGGHAGHGAPGGQGHDKK